MEAIFGTLRVDKSLEDIFRRGRVGVDQIFFADRRGFCGGRLEYGILECTQIKKWEVTSNFLESGS